MAIISVEALGDSTVTAIYKGLPTAAERRVVHRGTPAGHHGPEKRVLGPGTFWILEGSEPQATCSLRPVAAGYAALQGTRQRRVHTAA
jgi:hypothetical protein